MYTTIARLSILAGSLLLTFADPPIYPGSTPDAAYAQIAKDEGITSGRFYLTSDSFEKVKAFYKRAGKELPTQVPATGQARVAAFSFPHNMGVLVAWPAGNAHQTSIAMCEIEPATADCRENH